MPVSCALFRYASRRVRSAGSPKGPRQRSSSIWPLVSVPVLSLHRMSMLPKSSMAARCLTITFCRAMRTAPCARVTVVIIGRNSGVSPTASATANRNDSSGGRCRAKLASSTKSTRNSTVRMISTANRASPRWNSVSGGWVDSCAAMSPNAVAGPVATTTAVAVPLTTDVPRKTVLRASAAWRAPGGRSPASFSTGSDSPVRAASWTWRSRVAVRRASAGTRSPAARWMTSPGTSSRRGISTRRPSRSTLAVGATCSRSRSAARSDR